MKFKMTTFFFRFYVDPVQTSDAFSTFRRERHTGLFEKIRRSSRSVFISVHFHFTQRPDFFWNRVLYSDMGKTEKPLSHELNCMKSHQNNPKGYKTVASGKVYCRISYVCTFVINSVDERAHGVCIVHADSHFYNECYRFRSVCFIMRSSERLYSSV